MRGYYSHDRVSVCVSVTSRYCIKTAKCRITQTTPCDSPGTLVFWHQESLVEDPLPPEICAQSDPPPFEHQNVAQYQLIASASTVRAREKKVQLALIGRRPTTRFPTSHRWTVWDLGRKTRIYYFFPVNFNFCRKTSAAKFPRVKTSSGKVVAIHHSSI